MTPRGRNPRRFRTAGLLLVGLGGLLSVGTGCQHAPQPQAQPPAEQFPVETRALDILKAMSAKLAAAHTLRFTAVVSYEVPSRFGPPLVSTTQSEVTVQRPDKLRVLTQADGPAQEFYYNGKTMTAFAPAEKLIAVADAPPTLDAMLEAAYHQTGTYFPFTDLIVSDPYKDITDGLEMAFYIGRSTVVGGTTTDMVAYATNGTFIQAWIAVEDKLPRRARAVYRDDPAALRHQLDLSSWQLDLPVASETFSAPAAAAAATRIPFANPAPPPPPGAGPPPGQPAKP